MAALTRSSTANVVPLRYLAGSDVEDMLGEERRAWRERLDWDFENSADLVIRFLNMQSLSGFALVMSGKVAGYAYYVAEDHKGLIGDLYVMEEYRTVENENCLLVAILEELVHMPGVRRVESQLMMLSSPLDRVLPLARHASVFPRNFMAAQLTPSRRFPPRASAGKLQFENWKEEHSEPAAQVIAAAYRDHVDSRINDQYRSAAGARRFLENIVHYPGCGMFFQPASFVCRTQWDETLGLVLSSLVSDDVGHVTQICVSGQARGHGLGYEMMRRSMEALAFYGCRGVSLTVTTANENAVRLYEQMGFATGRRFGAFVWEGF